MKLACRFNKEDDEMAARGWLHSPVSRRFVRQTCLSRVSDTWGCGCQSHVTVSIDKVSHVACHVPDTWSCLVRDRHLFTCLCLSQIAFPLNKILSLTTMEMRENFYALKVFSRFISVHRGAGILSYFRVFFLFIYILR